RSRFLRQLARDLWRDRAHVDDDRSRLRSGEYAFFSSRDGDDIGRIGDHRDDDLARGRDLGWGVDGLRLAGRRIFSGELFGFARWWGRGGWVETGLGQSGAPPAAYLSKGG